MIALLRTHRDFRLLWTGETTSQVGNSVTTTVPVAWALGDLSGVQLLLVALAAGSASVVFDTVYRVFLLEVVAVRGDREPGPHRRPVDPLRFCHPGDPSPGKRRRPRARVDRPRRSASTQPTDDRQLRLKAGGSAPLGH